MAVLLQQTVVAACVFVGVLVLIPRMALGPGTAGREARPRTAAPRHRPTGPGRGQPLNTQFQNNPLTSPHHGMQQMKSVFEKEMNKNKIQGENKGYVFQMMPLYAIGIGVYVIYKLVQVTSKENEKLSQKKNKIDKKKMDTEYQLSELELRLAQTEKMLDSLVKELDPLASCVDAVATEQTSEIMIQLQQIRHLMKERHTPIFEDSASIHEGRIHLSENIQEREGIKMQWTKDQAIAESEEELQEDETLTVEVTPRTFHGNTETCHNNSSSVSEINSEVETCVGDKSEIFGPMRLRRRNKMNEYGKRI